MRPDDATEESRAFMDRLNRSIERLDHVASTHPEDHNYRMNQITPRELDARIETIDVKIESRLGRIDEKLADIDAHLKSTRNSVWGAAAVTIATVLGVMALVVSSFDSGRDTANLVSETQRKFEAQFAQSERQQAETQKLLQDAIRLLSSQAKP